MNFVQPRIKKKKKEKEDKKNVFFMILSCHIYLKKNL